MGQFPLNDIQKLSEQPLHIGGMRKNPHGDGSWHPLNDCEPLRTKKQFGYAQRFEGQLRAKA